MLPGAPLASLPSAAAVSQVVVSVSDDPVRIMQFWQAVEIFSPQTLPKLDQDPKKPTVDICDGAFMPWEADGRVRRPDEGRVWRHQVYGGLYDLSKVRDALVERLGQEQDEEPKPKGKSALFVCAVDDKGFIIPGTMVVSACAWGVGRVGRGQPVIGDFAADTERYADSLVTRAKIRAGLRILGEAIRNAVPDGVAAAVNAALAGVVGPLGPIGTGLAATAQGAAKTLAKAIVSAKDDDNTDGGESKRTQEVRLDAAAITGSDLRDFITWLADQLGVTESLRPDNVRVRSRQVKISRKDEDKADPFLNSFLYGDLSLVAAELSRGKAGPALRSYLTPSERIRVQLEAGERRRTNVRDDPAHALAWCRPHRIPPGRWVTGTSRALAFSQQFAVNRVIGEHGDGQPGLFAVNGPPGTGKTTMLRDLVAAIVVQRAEQLAKLTTPSDVFTGQPHAWPTQAYTHAITELKPEVTGHEIVVASSNNAAVENVTSEIPGPKGIDERWQQKAAAVDYFTATAGNVTGDGAWTLIAAVLGNSENRGKFVNSFWFGKDSKDRQTGTGMGHILKESAQIPSWRAAVSDFRRSLRKVQDLTEQRAIVSAHATGLSDIRAARDRASAGLREKTAERQAAEARRPRLAADHERLAVRQQSAESAVRAHELTRPGLFSGRRRRREWDAQHDQLGAELRQAAALATAAWESLSHVDLEISQARDAELRAKAAFGQAYNANHDAEKSIEAARARWGERLPDGPEYSAIDEPDLVARRELSSPWADEKFSAARTELFLSALALHKAFIPNARKQVFDSLNALTDMLAGRGRPKDPVAVLAAWQTLFLVVPVVSTTFASFGLMFAGLGRESLGWLLVDEAGQAAPQNAAGALWRSRRGVIVGDPLQLEPVVTLPWGGQRALLDQFRVEYEWAPSRSSVQRLADRLATDGTWLPGPGGGEVWVGAPLRVHRRCDHPMFKVSNAIAYQGLMVFGTPTDRDPFHGENAWIDVPPGAGGTNWNPAEGEMLRKVLTGLHQGGGVPASEIRVISPYRNVAEEARKIHKDLFPSVGDDDREGWVGTVHKMQGREADAVVLVLGGDPDRPGSRRFATQTPNLLNVAVTLARRRLYVIGDYKTWSNERFFTELKDPEILRYYGPARTTN
jgi:AAA domain-containing protein